MFKINRFLTDICLSLFFIFFSYLCLGASPIYGKEDLLLQEKLRTEHPRLMFTRTDQQRIEALTRENAFLQRLIDNLYQQADMMLSLPTVRYELKGPRLLHQSRACLAKVMTLSCAYRLSDNSKYAERAVEEMRAAAAFPDWNPSHFLDVGEMSAALAIGYDWLYDYLSKEDRAIIKNALVEKGLKPGLSVYPRGFSRKINNWNLVCNGGLIMAALAIADEEPVIAEEIVTRALASLPTALKNYAPDGAWFEGPAYWMYGTNYLAMLVCSLETALGSDFGLSEYPGMSNTGRFFINTIGPTGKFFNYADCRLTPRGAIPALSWLARRYDKPMLAWFERQLLISHFPHLQKRDAEYFVTGLDRNLGKLDSTSTSGFYDRFYALEIAWFNPSERPKNKGQTLDALFRSLVDVAFFRSSWDKDALYVGFKGGNNSVNHAHVDCGSFIFEALGQRWAEDLGPDNYNLPGYFEYQQGGRRWDYFRISSLSHNVPTINGQNQRHQGVARIITFHSSPERAHAVADLSTAYDGQAQSVRRGLALLERRALLIQDEVIGLNDGDKLRWAMLTSADIKLNGKRAELRREGKTVVADIIEPPGAVFATASTQPPCPDENPNKGTRLLTVAVPLAAKKTNTVAILLTPHQVNTPTLPTPEIVPLSEWKGH